MIAAKPQDLQGTRRRADQIERAARKLDRLIEHLLVFSQASLEGSLPVSLGPAELDEVARRVIADLDAESAARVTLETSGDTRGQWDARRLGHVFANLLSNALEHGDPGGRVTARIDGGDPRVVRLSVHNGGTIADATRTLLFEPFKSKSRLSSGIGLGLCVVECILREHGGKIEVRSSAENGTEFNVELPRTRGPAEVSASSEQR